MIYLDNAATSWPKPKAVYDTLIDFAKNYAGNPGRSGHKLSLEAQKYISQTRSRIARFINAESPEQIIFTLNGTDALNIAIKGIINPKDHVITSKIEHNSVNRPLTRLQKMGKVKFSKASVNGSGSIDPQEIEKLIKPNTCAIVITHCSNVIGQVTPVEEYAKIAKKNGITLIIDAAQTAGVVKIDVQKMGLDIVCLPGHKGLFGPMGTGVLYVRKGLELDFYREGGTGVNSDKELQPEDMPFRLEAGTPNAHGIAALGAALEFIEKEGVDKIRAHEQRLALDFIERLRSNKRITIYSGKNPKAQIGPVSIKINKVPSEEVAAILDQRYSIATRAGLHCAPGAHKFLGTFPQGTVRFSFGYFNTINDVKAAVKAVEEIARGYC